MANRRGDTSVFKQLNDQKIMKIQLMLDSPGFTNPERKMLRTQLKELKRKKFSYGGQFKGTF